MEETTTKNKEILERVKKDKVRFIQLQFTDMFGIVKSVAITVEHLADSLTYGTWFDGSSIEGFTRIHESDMYLKPDPETYALMPWISTPAGNTARFICDVYLPDGRPFEGDPRFILKKAMAEAKASGFVYNVGPELEFFLFKRDNGLKTLPHDTGGYFDLNTDQAHTIRAEMVDALESFGIQVEAAHHEVALGQHEIDFRYNNALTTADNAITLRFVLKAIAQKYDLHATFMPKPIRGINGSGMHVHQSFFDLTGKENLFYDPKDKYKLSKIAYQFIAGQLLHARGMSAIISPTVNSYKRLVPGYEAPVYICWARINRSALIRIPQYFAGKHLATRCELRCPDPSCNPYLAFAVMLKAGLDGIQRALPVSDPLEENIYHMGQEARSQKNVETLPESLGEALHIFQTDSVIKDALGKHTTEQYVEGKQAEWDDYRLHVSQWELDRYLDVY